MKFLFSKLFDQRGTASASRSAFYVNTIQGNAPYTGTDVGREVCHFFSHTVGGGTYDTGTTDTVSGTVKLFKHRKGWAFSGLQVSTDGLSASAGVGQTPVIGDGTTANKYMLASDMDAAAGIGLVNGASLGYAPTSDVPVTLTYGATGTPVAGAKIFGFLRFLING